jgi:hypothetical protein
MGKQTEPLPIANPDATSYGLSVRPVERVKMLCSSSGDYSIGE